MVSKRWTWLTGAAWLFAALTNAHGHVHYCFDGQEPPAAVHLVDSTDHDHELPGHGHDLPGHEHEGSEHDDLDLDLPNQALTKVFKHDVPALAHTLAWTVAAPAPARASLEGFAAAPPAPDPPYYRPPSRAPPR